MFDDPKPDDDVCMKVSDFNKLVIDSQEKAISVLLMKGIIMERPDGVCIYRDGTKGYVVELNKHNRSWRWRKDFPEEKDAIDFYMSFMG